MPDDELRCPNCGARNKPGARFCGQCGQPLDRPELAAAAVGAAASSLGGEIAAITDPLLRLADVGPGVLLTATLERVLAEAGPRQAEVLRRCAIPRWFDAEVLAVLRERPDGNERVLELLRDYSFVRQVAPARFAYDEAVRAALLREWRDARPDELRAIAARLAAAFDARAAALAPAAGDGRAVRTGAWELYEREALYLTLLADPPSGMARLRHMFDQAEAGHRIADAESLLQAAHGIAVGETDALWLRYLRARLLRATVRLDEATSELNGLLDVMPLDPLLGALARQTLGDVLAETGQWVRAIELYGTSREYFQATGRIDLAAGASLRIAQAYQDMAQSIGGWYVPAYPRASFWRWLGHLWARLLSLPFYLVAVALRRTPWSLPRPRYLASYQNWVLVWVYRLAQRWYTHARDECAAAGDTAGARRAEQGLAQVLTVFGYPDDALRTLDALREQTPPYDGYARAWIDRDRAAALIERGDLAAARPLLDGALAQFRALGDIRGEAAVLTLQGRAAALGGAAEAALLVYGSSLARYRQLGYAAAREQTLYDLRAWRRRVGPGRLADGIAALVAEEPVKRYVGRFPRSQLPYLQILSLIAFPLALLLLALFSPTQVVQAIAGPLSLETFYSPLRMLAVLAVLVPLYLLAYTVVALAVMFVPPRRVLEREQPDYLVTAPDGIARYDYRGRCNQAFAWPDVRRVVMNDRCIWARPMNLFSDTFLESSDGRDLRIDGITGWYQTLQDDIAQHLAVAGNPARAEQFGFSMLRSWSGAVLAAGMLLLLAAVALANNWAGSLAGLLPVQLVVAVQLIGLSGLLIMLPLAHWIGTLPLAAIRRLGLRSRWPAAVAALGLALGLAGALGQGRLRLAPLTGGFLIVGAFVLAQAGWTLLLPQRRWLGRGLVIAATLAAASLAFQPARDLFYGGVNQAAADRAAAGDRRAAEQALRTTQQILDNPAASAEERGSAWFNAGRALYGIGEYRAAWQAYDRALREYRAGGALEGDAGRRRAAVIIYNRALAVNKATGQDVSGDLQQACDLWAAVCPR